MNLIELNRSLVQLRLSGMAAVMETRLLQAQSESMAPIDRSPSWSLTNLPVATSDFWSGATSRRSSATQTSYSITSTSSSIPR